MNSSISGIIPVALTPFTESNLIDWDSYAELIEWYIDNGADALFAVCQSSEMHYLSLDEKVALAKFTMNKVNGRIPVVASGHVSNNIDDQLTELRAVAETGVDGVILVTNRFAVNKQADEKTVTEGLKVLVEELPAEIALGLYECPAPFRQLLSDDQIRYCADSGRFVLLKDVSCDLETVSRRAKLSAGSPLAIVNANAAIAWSAMKSGSAGFGGVFNNFHPDLYKWIYKYGDSDQGLAEELSMFLALAAMGESFGYPALAKLYHQRLGTIETMKCRAIEFDIREKFWALEALVDKIIAGTNLYRTKTTRAQTQKMRG